MVQQRLQELFEKYLEDKINQEEIVELQRLVQEEKNTEAIDEVLKKAYSNPSFAIAADYDVKEVFAELMQKAKADKAVVVPMRRTWIKWVAAASIIVLIVTGYVLWVTSKKSEVGSQKMEVAKTNDVPAPKGSKAMITLADGTKVYLDSAGSGTLAQQDNVKLVKLANGQIAYQNAGGGISTELKYNTLNNPRGSKVIDMTLSDGSHVWLNAGSSVTYPVSFVGNERKVEITGEAYFEVMHNAKKPFVVSKGETSVTVLGTHFNVNAYDDEDALRVTLLEGSVKVSAANKSVTIKPGEQAQMNGGNAIGLVVNRGVDVDEVMAWKNGKFSFKSTDLKSIMREIARWYDVDVNYEGAVANETITGEISRTVNVSQVMKMLDFAGIKFRIEGRKVTVLQ